MGDARGARWNRARAVFTLAMLLALVTAGTARADFGLVPGSFKADTFDGNGDPALQAGGHPVLATTTFDLNQVALDAPFSGFKSDGRARNIDVTLPAGFLANPQSAPVCDRAVLEALEEYGGDNWCPAASQVGLATIRGQSSAVAPSYPAPVYNLAPRRGNAAELVLPVLGVVVTIVPRLDPAQNYRIVAAVSNIPEGVVFTGQSIDLFGVPADDRYFNQRFCGFGGGTIITPPGCSVGGRRLPFVRNTTSCGQPQTSLISAESWEAPGVLSRADYTTPQSTTGCGALPFDPTIDVSVDEHAPDVPSGMSFRLTVPQNEDPDGIASADLRRAQVTLPEGMTINPASAGGLAACTDAQLKLRTDDTMTCPDAARVGTVEATTPLLAEKLTGGIYLRSQNSSDPESGEMFRIALVLRNEERGIDVRLPGSIKADKLTGRLVTTFDDNPQLPVSEINLKFKSGPRAPLATPATCGRKTVDAQLLSWSGKTVDTQSSFDVDCSAGLGAFSPTFTAGAANPVGGAFSPFDLSIVKPDGNTALTGLRMELPQGLLANLKGNLGQQVGSVKAFAGPGSNPYMLPGKVFLEGQYGDAPFSLRAVVPAVAGPFDLGEVVVRQKIYVDPITAQVTVVSDPLPTIVAGVPVRLQRLEVSVDKPGFMVNPTSCAAKSIGGALTSVAGQTAAVSVRFQVGDCASLGLKPSLALSLSGKGQKTDGKHPAVTANLVQPSGGQANLKKVRVALPLSLALDPDNANGLCEFVDGSKVTPTCPKESIVGSVTATTPILDEPMSGPVYFVKNVRKDPKSGRDIRTLPKLVIPLTGQNGLKLTLTGTSDVEDDQLVTTFDNIPDAPVSSFKLNINGGKGGILAISDADICKSTQIAEQQVDGQNTKQADTDVYIQTPSCPTKILRKTITKSTVKLKIGGLGAGKVTVTGRGIRKTIKAISKSTVATITAKRTGKAKPGAFKVKFTRAKAAKAIA